MDVLKNGWHPKGKDGERESWRGDFNGINQVAGWVGKGKTSNTASSRSGSDHISRPLPTLKDPTSFGPPPKNVNFHGAAALPDEITPDRRGLGAPLSEAQVQSADSALDAPPDPTAAAKQPRPPAPAVPYRATRSGLRTDTLPPPPITRGTGMRTDASTTQQTGVVQAPAKPKPKLPPRLPPRSNSVESHSPVASPATITSPPPAYEAVIDKKSPPGNAYINQSAVGRLSNAGISVPSLGIRRSTTDTPATVSPESASNQVKELQSWFSRTTVAGPPAPSPPPSEGTSLAQKQTALQTALQTAHSFHKDPASVSLSDAQTAARTANNFRERHQEQITAGAQKAQTWNKRYNITSKVNTFLEKQAQPPGQQGEQSQNPTPAAAVETPEINSRKPPPPPPSRKPSAIQGHAASLAQAPPPVPLGTKPSLG